MGILLGRWGPALLFVAVVILIKPWGNFPLNDDWVYSVLTRHFFETGEYRAFLPTAASMMIQALTGSAFLKVFGDSEYVLRLSTLFVAAWFLFCIDWLLSLIPLTKTIRRIAMATLILNPLFLNLTLSYMSELHGMALAYTGVCFWFAGGRQRLAGALLMGMSFWTRQQCALVFPACIAVEICINFQQNGLRGLRDLKKSIPHLLIYGGAVASYFVWAAGGGHITHTFSDRLTTLLSLIPPQEWFSKIGVFTIYITAFSLPLLIAVPLQASLWNLYRRPALLLAALVFLASILYIGITASPARQALSRTHSHFPLLWNVMASYGVGPITLTDVFVQNGPVKPQADEGIWRIVHIVLVFLSLHWFAHAKKVRNPIFLFALFNIGIQFLILVAMFRDYMFDRYLIELVPSALILGAGLVQKLSIPERRLTTLAIFSLIPIGIYSVGGTHDYFRWNEARWNLVNQAISAGIRPEQLDGGYEVNGMLQFAKHRPLAEFDPDCGEHNFWFCPNRPYEIAMSPRRNGRILAQITPATWLVEFPPLLLQRK